MSLVKINVLSNTLDPEELCFLNDKQVLSHSSVKLSKVSGQLVLQSEEFKTPFSIDFLSGDFIYRLNTTSKKQPLLKALKMTQDLKVIDGTAGLGRDALTMAFHGAHVISYEVHPVLYLMLQNALNKLKSDKIFNKFKGTIEFKHGDVFDVIPKSIADILYIDPMYEIEDKNAKSRKEVVFLKFLGIKDFDIPKMYNIFKDSKLKRMILKRPPDAEKVLSPSYSIDGKLVRFDIYNS